MTTGPSAVALRTLDRATLQQHLEDALAIDDAARAELGDAYSHESWGADAFLAERPGKWRVSTGAFAGGRLVGFLIASISREELHLHRLAVAPAARRLPVAVPLMARAEALARQVGLPSLSLSVALENVHARAFYQRLGYGPLEGDALRAYAAARGLACDRTLVRAAGREYAIMRKVLPPAELSVAAEGRGRAPASGTDAP